MKLRELLDCLPYGLKESGVEIPETILDTEIKGLCTNSHACHPGDLFIGMPGTRVDGGEFWSSALEAGAIAAVVSPDALRRRPCSDPSLAVIPLLNMPVACGAAAAAFYGYPAKALELVGVTGTNGKTTTTHLIEFLLQAYGRSTALLGTLYGRWPNHQRAAQHTTPFAVDLQADLAAAGAAGAEIAVMEVSSHALAQERVWGCSFTVSVFTNLTQDHLDFHKDLEDYFNAKARLFSPQYLKGRAVINREDPYGQRLIAQLDPDELWTYSVTDSQADLYTRDLSYQANGVSGVLCGPTGEIPFCSPLVGQFNLENLLAASGAALALGVPLAVIAAALPQFGGVPGRMERVQVSPDQPISVIVDYAHTPDSLQTALEAARPFIPGRLICVFGCGGDRDRSKRPQMGRIAYDLADAIVITSDNPRTEDPERILRDIAAGIPTNLEPGVIVCDRAAAIRQAIAQARPGDGILIAGKGHEDYQILGTEKVHFDDREQARDALVDCFH